MGQSRPVLVEVRPIGFGEVRLVFRQFVQRKDSALWTDAGAVAAIDALVWIDAQMSYCSGSRIALGRGNGGSGALRDADKILGAGIGYDVSHDESPYMLFGALGSRANLFKASQQGWAATVTRITG